MIEIRRFEPSNRFVRDIKSAPPEVQAAAKEALDLLQSNPSAKVLRLHQLRGLPKPSIWKIDVYANRSWQITFEVQGDSALLKRLGTHKAIDRLPR